MRTAAVRHRKNQPLLLIQADQVKICDGNRCAAALLSVFEYWHSVRVSQVQQEKAMASADAEYKPNTSLWVYKQVPDLSRDILGMYGDTAVSKAVAFLIEKGFVKSKNNDKNPFDRTKMYLLCVSVVQAAVDAIPDDPEGDFLEKTPTRDGESTACKTSNQGQSLLETTDIETTVDEEPEAPKNSFQSAQQIDQYEARRLIEAGGKRTLKPAERKTLAAICPIPTSPGDFTLAIERSVEWASDHGIRDWTAMFLKDPSKWLTDQPTSRQRRKPAVPLGQTNHNCMALATKPCSTIQEFIQQCNNCWFVSVVDSYVKNGMAPYITLPVLEEFWELFSTLSSVDQEAMSLNAKVLFPLNKGFIKKPKNYFADKPWTAPTVVVDTSPRMDAKAAREAEYKRLRDKRKAAHEARENKLRTG